MKVSKQIRKINGEKPDWIMDDIQDIGYWNGMETAAQIAEDLEKETQLNDNQKIVLEWLKYPLNDIPNRFAENYFAYVTCLFLGQAPDKVLKAYQELSPEQQLEVLAAFADLEMKEVAE